MLRGAPKGCKVVATGGTGRRPPQATRYGEPQPPVEWHAPQGSPPRRGGGKPRRFRHPFGVQLMGRGFATGGPPLRGGPPVAILPHPFGMKSRPGVAGLRRRPCVTPNTHPAEACGKDRSADGDHPRAEADQPGPTPARPGERGRSADGCSRPAVLGLPPGRRRRTAPIAHSRSRLGFRFLTGAVRRPSPAGATAVSAATFRGVPAISRCPRPVQSPAATDRAARQEPRPP
jgi:hypothetical protein